MQQMFQWICFVCLVGTVLVGTITAVPLTQSEVDRVANDLSVHAEVLDNLLKNAVSHKVRITLGNNGTQPIPDSGWTLYFHSMYLVFPTIFPKNMTVDLPTERVRVGMVQGDLYYMQPITGFVALASNEARNYDIEAAAWSVSRTDFMPNWYLVSTDTSLEPRVVKATSSMALDYVRPFDDLRKWKRFNMDMYNPFTAQARMRRLEVTDTGKVEKLVIPTPQTLSVIDGPTLYVDTTWVIQCSGQCQAANYLAGILGITVKASQPGEKVITFSLSPTQGTVAGAYSLNTKPATNTILLTGRDEAGLLYAVQSLRSILDGFSMKEIPAISITDEPRFQYRGMYVDVARNFHSVDDLKRLMDAMAMYKMNKLHVHLADDEGWRLEIDGLPELTTVGGKRCHTLDESLCIIPQFGSGPFHNSSGTGFYTKSDYQNLLRYADERHIEIIPEFDMPGHAHAAIASMEERFRAYNKTGNDVEANKYRLADPDDKSVYISVQQWMDNAVNPCQESTYTFIQHVLDAVIALHKGIQPLQTYHFGGDEVAATAWQDSPRCEQFLTDNQQYNISKGLKMYFAERVSALTALRGVGMRGWEDGFMDGDGNPFPLDQMNNTKMSANPWDNIWEWGASQRAYRLANAGYKVVMSQATNLYFDHPQEPDPEERGLYWATRFTDTYKTFGFLPDSLYDNIYERRSGEPLSKTDADACGADLSKCDVLNKKENVIGMQGHLWSETIRTSENFDYMIFPRILAVAERAWHKASFEEEGIDEDERGRRMKDDWTKFANTIGYKELKRLESLGIKYRVPPPGGRVDTGRIIVSTTYPGLQIQYSRDGGTTWSNVTKDTELQWQQGSTMHLRTLSAAGTRSSRVVQLFEKDTMAPSVQPTLDYMSTSMSVHVAVVDNLNKVDNYMTMELTLRNTGGTPISTGTWKLYFYSLYGAKIEILDCGLRVGHVNGGLFYFTPAGNNFTGIAAGQALTCTFHSKWWTVARTDQFPNWYFGATGMEAKVVTNTVDESLSFVGAFDAQAKWKRIKEDKYNPWTAEERYELYKGTSRADKTAGVVPSPLKVEQDPTQSVNMTTWTVVQHPQFKGESLYIADKLRLPLRNAVPKDRYIMFTQAPVEPTNNTQSYRLQVDPGQQTIIITSTDAKGAMYGVQTLLGLVEAGNGILVNTNITDMPRFPYRGVMVDTARNFKPKQWILTFLDTMVTYKLNKLHLHLTDDEAWRVEVPGIPELTQIGSKRCQSDYTDSCLIPQLGSGPDDSTTGSGYYTIQDYRDILTYATARHIEVIPEIDMPGHSAAAIASMSYRQSQIAKSMEHHSAAATSFLLNDVDYHNAVESVQQWRGNAINPCINSTYDFISSLLDGFKTLYEPVVPLKVFHLGGDEVPEGVWDESQACKQEHGASLSTTAVKRAFVKRVADIVGEKGLNLAAWEDGVYGDNKPNPISDYSSSEVYAYPWSNRWDEDKAKRASEFADAGYKVVLPMATNLYFDHPQEPDPEERGLYWATRYTDTPKVFGFMPDNIFANADYDRMGNRVDLNKLCNNKPCPMPNMTENIIGMQACMFSETMRTEEQFHHMGFPRLLALAERAWHKASWEELTDAEQRNKARDLDWETFQYRLGQVELPRLEKNGIKYRVPPPGARIEDSYLKVNTRYPQHGVEWSTDGGTTWSSVVDEVFLTRGVNSAKLRSISKHLKRPSRPITIQREPVISSSDRIDTGTAVWALVLLHGLVTCMI